MFIIQNSIMIITMIIILVIIFMYIFMIKPRMTKTDETKSFKTYFYAHRGLFDNNNGIPENSILAFDRAIKNGYGIELDVHVTKDKKCIVFHDDNLKRMTSIDNEISNMTYDEIKKAKLLNTNIEIPLFDEVLRFIDGRVPLIIEIKSLSNSLNESKIIQQKLDAYNGKYCIESFNPLVLLWYRKNRRSIIRGQLSTNYLKDKVSGSKIRNFMLTYLFFNVLSRPDFISYNFLYKTNISFIACTQFLEAIAVAWTIHSEIEYKASKKYFDIFIFQDFLIK